MASNKERIQQKILEVAEQLFAQKGFDGVSIREITSQAKVNTAAVNYYFQDKKTLYLEVFRQRWIKRAQQHHLFLTRLAQEIEKTDLNDLIPAILRTFLLGPMNDTERKVHNQLINRELNAPTEAFEIILSQAIDPLTQELTTLLQKNSDQEISKQTLSLITLSITALGLYFNFARPIVQHILHEEYNPELIEKIIQTLNTLLLPGLTLILRGQKKDNEQDI